jgi:Helicase C-terminal domain
MSATLGAGGDLERLTGRPTIKRLPIPEGWDRQGIGRRLFLFPEQSLSESEVQQLRRSLMQIAGRSLVLAPSDKLADEIIYDIRATIKFPVVSAADLELSKASFIEADEAVAVVANRYDGIDLPDDECRLLFIDGLPRAINLQERFLMNRMGANLLYHERVQTRALQAVGRCTRGLKDFSAVVVTGQDLPSYLIDKKRRKLFHPELQAELEFGVDQSKEMDHDTFIENFEIFLEQGKEWEEANAGILAARDKSTQDKLHALDELAGVVKHEIAWQRALWDAGYRVAYEAAREVLGGLDAPELRGYRALWHYLAGSAAELAVSAGDLALEAQARAQFTKAKKAASGIPWLISLARRTATEPPTEEQEDAALMLQVERLEEHLQKLGDVHNRSFSAREREIRDGLNSGATFEQAQMLLGEHLGFETGKREVDASPDPWWRAGGVVIVFEDHANAKGGSSIIDATKARQAASHPDWVRICSWNDRRKDLSRSCHSSY